MLTTEQLQALTDADLATLHTRVMAESNRRDDLRTYPGQIEQLTQRFVDRGGDKTRLRSPAAYEPQGPSTA